MKLAALLERATNYLKHNQIEEPRLEAEILLAFYLKIGRIKLAIDHNREITEKETEGFDQLLGRRASREPSAYIIGSQPFLALNILVDRSVLVPRPETELLVETILDEINKRSMLQDPWSIADIGTGSGAIAVSLAKNLPNAKAIGIDTSPEALQIAQKNAESHQVCDRCLFVQGDLLDPLREPVDIIISNPPYIPSAEIEILQPEVRDWEPRSALDGGEDGLKYIRQLIDKCPGYLKPGGWLVFEFGFGQAGAINKMIELNGKYHAVKIIKDYSGIDRILSAKLNDPRQ